MNCEHVTVSEQQQVQRWRHNSMRCAAPLTVADSSLRRSLSFKFLKQIGAIIQAEAKVHSGFQLCAL